MMRVESAILSPSRSSTGSVPCRENSIARGLSGRSERRTCGMPLKSRTHRAFSLKFEKLYCQRTGGVTRSLILRLGARDRQRGIERLDHDLRPGDPFRTALLREGYDLTGADEHSGQPRHVAARVALDVDERRYPSAPVVRGAREAAAGQCETPAAVSLRSSAALQAVDVDVAVAQRQGVDGLAVDGPATRAALEVDDKLERSGQRTQGSKWPFCRPQCAPAGALKGIDRRGVRRGRHPEACCQRRDRGGHCQAVDPSGYERVNSAPR